MRVEIALRKGEDPHVYDADSKKEISAIVQSISLFPGREGVAVLALLKRNEKGLPYVEGEGEWARIAEETVEAELAYLRGDWESR